MNASLPTSNSSLNASFWDVVDAALVINLDHRSDRWEKVREHLKSIVPDEKLHRVSAVLAVSQRTFIFSRRLRLVRHLRPHFFADRNHSFMTMPHRASINTVFIKQK